MPLVARLLNTPLVGPSAFSPQLTLQYQTIGCPRRHGILEVIYDWTAGNDTADTGGYWGFKLKQWRSTYDSDESAHLNVLFGGFGDPFSAVPPINPGQ